MHFRKYRSPNGGKFCLKGIPRPMCLKWIWIYGEFVFENIYGNIIPLWFFFHISRRKRRYCTISNTTLCPLQKWYIGFCHIYLQQTWILPEWFCQNVLTEFPAIAQNTLLVSEPNFSWRFYSLAWFIFLKICLSFHNKWIMPS